MELIDTHCHLTFDDLARDIDGVIERSRQAGVSAWITVGTDIKENQKAVELAGRFENLYAAVAIHPHDAKTVTADTIARLKRLAQNEKVVAIGETGLDYHYDHSLHHDQRRAFAQHLKIAARHHPFQKGIRRDHRNPRPIRRRRQEGCFPLLFRLRRAGKDCPR
jgi:TatD DNase family protein